MATPTQEEGFKLTVQLHQYRPFGRETVLHHRPVHVGDERVSKHGTPAYSNIDFI